MRGRHTFGFLSRESPRVTHVTAVTRWPRLLGMNKIIDGLNRLKQMPGTITPEFVWMVVGAYAIDPKLFDVVIAFGRYTGDVKSTSRRTFDRKIDLLRARAAVRRSR